MESSHEEITLTSIFILVTYFFMATLHINILVTYFFMETLHDRNKSLVTYFFMATLHE